MMVSMNGTCSGSESRNRTQVEDTDHSWSVVDSSELYRIKGWGEPYFAISEGGSVTVMEIDLSQVVKNITDPRHLGGLAMNPPLLIRFPDILKHRLDTLHSSFDSAMAKFGYDSAYQGVYPVKCNHNRHVVETILEHGSERHFGLEAGSKPELLLAMSALSNASNRALLICNGYKDMQYITLALHATVLTFNCIIVIEQERELEILFQASQKFPQITPVIGIRAKLRTMHAGHFGDTSGENGKFGLTMVEVVNVVKKLKVHGMIENLQLLHFHIGSQIPSLCVLEEAVSEASLIYSDLVQMGAKNMKVLDIGGGLGIAYTGVRSSTSEWSVEYSLEEYAFTVVKTVQLACKRRGVKCPVICSESGRALVSHHSVFVFDILYTRHHNAVTEPETACNGVKGPCDVKEWMELWKDGKVGLEEMAMLESSRSRNKSERSSVSVCHVNMSVFRSLTDLWSIGQPFPMMPIQRLKERPVVRVALRDLTCDSFGKAESFIDGEPGVAMHGRANTVYGGEGKPYYVGVFLCGAYQEALGGIHNLFGSPGVVHVLEKDGGYEVVCIDLGQTAGELLKMTMHEPDVMLESLRRRMEKLRMKDSKETANDFDEDVSLNYLGEAFNSSPYLSPA